MLDRASTFFTLAVLLILAAEKRPLLILTIAAAARNMLTFPNCTASFAGGGTMPGGNAI